MCLGLFRRRPAVSRVAYVADFPSMSAGALFRVLTRAPLSYRVVRQTGSHRRLVSSTGYPTFSFAYHDGRTLPGFAVRKVLVRDVGLTEDKALAILRR